MFLLAHISTLHKVQDLMETWGYPVLFGLLFSCGLGLPLPEDVPLLLAGYFVSIGKMHLGLAALSGWLGIVGGDCMLYMFGRKYGMGVTKLPLVGKEITAQRIKWVEGKFQRYGVLVVAVGRMFAVVRGAMVITAGTIRFRFIPFIIADGLAAIVSGGLFMSLGYWFGRKLGDLDSIAKKIHGYEYHALAVLLLIVALVFLWYRFRRKPPRHRRPRRQFLWNKSAACTSPRPSGSPHCFHGRSSACFCCAARGEGPCPLSGAMARNSGMAPVQKIVAHSSLFFGADFSGHAGGYSHRGATHAASGTNLRRNKHRSATEKYLAAHGADFSRAGFSPANDRRLFSSAPVDRFIPAPCDHYRPTAQRAIRHGTACERFKR